ncbi:VOC family protein [Variovorax fucosicus]|uniref:VOC family protein n=1 Tax=Variovorax fucosicus TaxID=3053517 RepID=UPI002576760D|nr:VOC family protein [Variovorax sp. J22G47]MDM0058864.1 VOC family protein [Variovorax sp. J22G47]
MIIGIDHIVLTVRSLDVTCEFYARVLGFRRSDVQGQPTGLHFGQQKINVHETGRTFDPKAVHPTPGSADVCFITEQSIEEVCCHLKECNVEVEVGPISRTGARGEMTSVYFRDPDNNLIEVASY